ncbi:DUF5663 domain-containing protein [Candidatus Saccharibacteria bacterium]|nr:DUF5663 domain-containing protein [Candidatus Saccharibacteria bacterium]
MFELDRTFLEGLGVDDMPEAEMKAFLEHLQEEMEVRVGERMSEGMTEAQIEEFEKIIDGEGEDGDMSDSAAWLEKNCPQYKSIVQDVMAELKEEIRAGKDRI